jgi:stage III sporulation protein AE
MPNPWAGRPPDAGAPRPLRDPVREDLPPPAGPRRRPGRWMRPASVAMVCALLVLAPGPGAGAVRAQAVAAGVASDPGSAGAPAAPGRAGAGAAPAGRASGPDPSATGGGDRGATGAATVYGLAERQLENLDTSAIQGFVRDLDRQLQPYGGGLSWRDLTALVLGRGGWQPGRLGRALLAAAADEVRANLHLLGELMVLVVLASLLGQIRAAFEGDAVARVADGVVFLALGSLALGGFVLAGHVASGAVDSLVSFMMAILPALLALLAAGGGWASAGLLHPLMVVTVNAVSLAVRAWVFPLVFLAAVLDMVGALSPSFRLSSLSGFLRQVGLGLLGLMLAMFIGVVAVEGAAGAVADGVALRAAKYAARLFVPVVGSMFADATELVVTSGLLLRSGLGVAGLVLVGLLVALPLIKLVVLWGAYRVSAAVAQPVGGEAVAHVLGGVAATLSLVAVTVAAVGLMCFLALASLVAASGAAVALR